MTMKTLLIYLLKGNTYVIDDVTKQAVPLKAEGYVNGKRANNYDAPVYDPETGEPKLDNQGNPIYEQYQIFYNSEQIDSIHNDYIYSSYYNMLKKNEDAIAAGEPAPYSDEELAAKKEECDQMAETRKYVLSTGNQAFWGWITFKVEAGKSYWLFQDSSQVGFGGYEFNTGDDPVPPTDKDLTTIVGLHSETPVTINLEANTEYTMSGPINVTDLTIAGVEGANATIKMADGATFSPKTNLVLKNLDIYASGNPKAIISLNETPIESSLNAEGGYYIFNNIEVKNCNITDATQLIYDSGVKYCVANMLVDNSLVSLNAASKKTVVDFSTGGFVNDLTIKNSTFYNKGADQDYFVRYTNAGRCDRAGFATNSITYENNTFYNVAKEGQWGNYSGFAGRGTSYWTMTKNIFVDCGSGQVARRYLGGRQNQATATFAYNTYWFGGAAEDPSGYDTSETILASDPLFKDAANADFTVQGEAQITNKTGDPRWLDANAIVDVQVLEDNTNAPVYNLAGQRVSPSTKGILIKNGKKYVNK